MEAINDADLLQLVKNVIKNTIVIEDALSEKHQDNKPNTKHELDEAGCAPTLTESQEKTIAESITATILTEPSFREELEKIVIQTTKKFVDESTEKIYNQLDDSEQYSRRNCILLHGIPKQDDENTDDLVLRFISDQLHVDLDDFEIDRTHRLKPFMESKHPSPIIIKFVRHNIKQYVYYQKRKLKNSGYLITESLTSRRYEIMKKLKDLLKMKKISAFWTNDGRIFYMKSRVSHKVEANSVTQLNELFN